MSPRRVYKVPIAGYLETHESGGTHFFTLLASSAQASLGGERRRGERTASFLLARVTPDRGLINGAAFTGTFRPAF